MAALHASLFCCAVIQAARLERAVLGKIAAHLAAGSMTVSAISLRNLWMEQVSAVHLGVCLLW